jgi:hypothetical protein
MLIDRVIAARGKFRPSPAAQKLGEVALKLERHVYRDGISFSVACERLRTDDGVTLSDAELEALFGKLPRRYRREHVSPESLEQFVSRDSAEDIVIEDERAKRNARVAQIIKRWKASLSEGDALIMSYWPATRVADIARILGIKDKRVYDRVAVLKKLLKRALSEEGIQGPDA